MGTMAETSRPETGLTLEGFWAAFVKSQEEFDRRMHESREDFERQRRLTEQIIQETARQMQETDRQIQETARQMLETDRKMQETAQQIRNTDRQLGALGNKFGSMVEHLVLPNLIEKFNALGFTFTKYGPNQLITDKSKNIAAEVDLFLENGDCAIAVEVKAQLKIGDIDEHVERMGTLRRYADAHRDARKLYGAVAGAIMHDNVREYALKTGFFVISQSGDTMNIDVPKGFEPRAW
jgi:hypothetical protein